MNSASRHSIAAQQSLLALLLVASGLLGSAAGCAIDASDPSDPAGGSGPSLGHQQQAVVANTDTVVHAKPQLAQVPTLVAPIEPDKRPVVVLSAPVSTNGGGVGQGGSDEGPRPNPWTPPPESKSEDTEGKGNGTGGTPGTGTDAPEVEGAGTSKSAPTK